MQLRWHVSRAVVQALEPRRLLAAVGPDGFGHLGDSAPYEAIDLSPSDAGVGELVGGFGQSGSLNLGFNRFRFYGVNYSTLYVLSAGLIVFSAPTEISPTQPNSNLSSEGAGGTLNPQQAAIAVLWDDWQVGSIPPDTATRNVLYKYDADNQRVIIEWNQVRGWGDEVTFQAMLQLNTGTTDGAIKLNYVDVETADLAGNNGLSSTVGIKAQGAFAPTDYLRMHYNTISARVGSGNAILITQGPPPDTSGSISGHAFWDHDADRVLDAGEEALAGVTVWLDLNNNQVMDEAEPRQVSGAGGEYTFANRAAGTYTLRAQVTPTHVAPFFGQQVTVATAQAAVADIPLYATTYAGTSGNDDYGIRFRAALGDSVYEILRNGLVEYAVTPNWISYANRRLSFLLGDGDDTLTVDDSNGLVRDVIFDGGAQATAAGDLLRVQGAISTVSSRVNLSDASLPLRPQAIALGGAERVTASVAMGALWCGVLSLPAGTSVTVNGGSGNDTLTVGDDHLSPAQNNADAVDGDITFIGGGGQDLLGLRDDANTAAGLFYAIAPSSLSRNGTGTFTHSQVESISITGGSNAPTFNIVGTAPGTTLGVGQVNVSGGPNNPAAYVIGPSLSALLGTLSLNPTFGSTLIANDLGEGNASYTINFNTLSRTGGGNPIPLFSGTPFQTVTLNAQDGDNTINLLAVPNGTTLHVNGNGGNDSFITPGVLPRLNLDGGAGNDSLTVDAGGGSSALVARPMRLNAGSNETNFTALEGLTLNMEGGSDNVTVYGTAPATAVAVNLGDGDDILHVTAAPNSPLTFAGGLLPADDDTVNLNAGSFTFASDLSAATANLSLNIGGGATAHFAAVQHLASLSVVGSATVATGGANAIVTRALAVDGTLDLADNDLVIDYDSLSPVGIWTGDAYDGATGLIDAGRITSSTALENLKMLGVAEARDALGITGMQTGSFAGRAVDSTSVLVKFTWGGDATLDGKINIDDYGRIDGNVSQSGSVWGWFNGDFNLDGKINIDDFGIIDGNVAAQDGIL